MLICAELPIEVSPKGFDLAALSMDDAVFAVFVSAEGGDADAYGFGEVFKVRLESGLLGVSGSVEEGNEGVGFTSSKSYVEDDDRVDVGTGVGEASEDVLEDDLEVPCDMCGLEEGGGVVVRRPGSALGDGGEADGELGLCQRPLDDFGAWGAGFWVPNGG